MIEKVNGAAHKIKFIDTKKFSLGEWLDLLKNPQKDATYIDYQFPSERLREEYLSTISARTDAEIRFLLRRFLVPSGKLNHDDFRLEYLLRACKSSDERTKEWVRLEQNRRLIIAALTKGAVAPWEGITWVMDLLPFQPREALSVIQAYTLAHAQSLPDGRLIGLADALSIIRARYITSAPGGDFARATLRAMNKWDFEYLVAHLYAEMGYRVGVTSARKDGGLDISARRDDAGQRECIAIQCKNPDKNKVDVKVVREILGVVSTEKLSRGVVVTSREFTRDARRFESAEPRVELIDGDALVELLNGYCGAGWAYHVDQFIVQAKRGYNV